jgi:hypothetical protein
MNKRLVFIACALAAACFFVFRPAGAVSGLQDDRWLEDRTLSGELEAVRNKIRTLEERDDRIQDQLKHYYQIVDPTSFVLDLSRDYTSPKYDPENFVVDQKNCFILCISEKQLTELAYTLAWRDFFARGDDGLPVRGDPKLDSPEFTYWLAHLTDLSQGLKPYVRSLIPAKNKELAEVATRIEALNAREKELSDRLVELRKGKKPGAGTDSAIPDDVRNVAGTWKFGRCQAFGKDVDDFLCNIVLTTNYVAGKGYKLTSNHVNESFWELQGDNIIFKNDKGTTSTTFKPNGKDSYEGKYELDPKVEVMHYLRK